MEMTAKRHITARERGTEKLLVCVANNDASKAALRLACLKAKKRGDQVDILTVIEPADFQSLLSVSDQIARERREQAEKLLESMAEIAQTEGITPSLVLREGKIGEEIVSATMEDSNISMLVLGVYSQSATAMKLVTWLSQRLGSNLLVPVLLVPGNLTDQQIESLA